MTRYIFFSYPKLPRSTTKEEWKEIYRWERLSCKIIEEKHRKMFEDLAIYGTATCES